MPTLLNVVRLASELLSLQREKSLSSLIRPARLILAVLGGFVLVGLWQGVMTTQGRVQTAWSFHPSLPGQVSLAGTQSYSDTTFCAVLSGDPGSACDYADLAVEKTVSDSTPEEGATIVYVVTVTNHGPRNASSVELTDEVPAGVTYITHTVSHGVYTNSLWAVGWLANGENATLTITAMVAEGTGGTTITNTTTVTAIQPDRKSDNNEDSVSITPISAVHYLYLPFIVKSFCVPFTDTLSSSSSGWKEVDNKELKTEYVAGEYRMLTRNERLHYAYNIYYGSYFADNEVQVDARWAGSASMGKGYGIVFGLASDESHAYVFQVNAKQREYRLLRFSGGSWWYNSDDDSWKSLTDTNAKESWVYTDTVYSGLTPNRLKVTRSGSKIVLYINGTHLKTAADNVIKAGRVGLSVQSYDNDPVADVRFDNYVLDYCKGTANVVAVSTLSESFSSVGTLPPPQ